MKTMDRRQFLRTAALTVRAQHDAAGAAPNVASSPGALRALKQVTAGPLEVSYAEIGAPDGKPVLLLHGWPYDIHTYIDVAPLLAAAGYRVIVPYLRGYGTTRFLSSDTFRNGQPSALAVDDAVRLMDALRIDKAIVAGCDWGARTANVIAASWPERCKAMVSVSGYLIGSRQTNRAPLAAGGGAPVVVSVLLCDGARACWIRHAPQRLRELIWRIASPHWEFDEATFARTADAFTNPDHVAVVIHNYRWRLQPGRRGMSVRRVRTASWRGSRDYGAHHHDGGRRQRCATPESECLR